MNAITFPARPVNGGPLPLARPKCGDWFYTPKYNGWRALIHIASGTMFGRHGQVLSLAREEFQDALELLRATLNAEAFQWADCEALERRHSIGRGSLFLIDLVPEPQSAAAPWVERQRWLHVVPRLAPETQPESGSIYRIPWIEPEYALGAWDRLQEINRAWGAEFYEGLVAKRADSIYPVQLRSARQECVSWMKHRWQY